MTRNPRPWHAAACTLAAALVLLTAVGGTGPARAEDEPATEQEAPECLKTCKKHVATKWEDEEESYCVCCTRGTVDDREYWSVDPNTYQGWRTYETFCFVCHGKDGKGMAQKGGNAEELIVPRLVGRDVFWDYPRFRDLVAGPIPPTAEATPWSSNGVQMPAWRNHPHVSRHYWDLYVYLLARDRNHLPHKMHQRLRSVLLDPAQAEQCGLGEGAAPVSTEPGDRSRPNEPSQADSPAASDDRS